MEYMRNNEKSPSTERRGSLQVNPSYGDVLHLYRDASIPIEPIINEALSTNIKKIKERTNSRTQNFSFK